MRLGRGRLGALLRLLHHSEGGLALLGFAAAELLRGVSDDFIGLSDTRRPEERTMTAVLNYAMYRVVHAARHTPTAAREVEGAIGQAIKNTACGHEGLTMQLDMAWWTRAARSRSSADSGEAPPASSTEPSLRR